MDKGLGLINLIGVIGSVASIVSITFSTTYTNQNHIHYFYGAIILLITIIATYLFVSQRNKINNYESIDYSIDKHIKNFAFTGTDDSYKFSTFIEATKSFVQNNSKHFVKDYDDLIRIANKGIEYGNRDNPKNIDNDKHFAFASALKAKIQSYKNRIG